MQRDELGSRTYEESTGVLSICSARNEIEALGVQTHQQLAPYPREPSDTTCWGVGTRGNEGKQQRYCGLSE